MGFPRSFLNLTNLPDGTVLATGGGTDKSSQIDANGVLVPESWDPATGTVDKAAPRWRSRVSTTRSRLLLPDGRVLRRRRRLRRRRDRPDERADLLPAVPVQGRSADDLLRAGDRPVRRRPRSSGRLTPASIRRVSLIRTGSVTHAFDQNARDAVARLHAERRRHRRAAARERQRRAARLLHALHRRRQGRAVGGLVRPLPRALRGRRGAERADEPRARPGASAQCRSRGRRRPTTLASRSTTSTARRRRVHAVRGEQGRPEHRRLVHRQRAGGRDLPLPRDGRGRRRQRRAAVGRGDRGPRSPTRPRPRSPAA